jgi:hypothetical protein
LRRKRHLKLKIDSSVLQVSTPFFGLGQALPAEMFRGAKEKVRFSDPPQVSFSDLEKLPADKLLGTYEGDFFPQLHINSTKCKNIVLHIPFAPR